METAEDKVQTVKKVYRSKLGLELIIPIGLVLGIVLMISFLNKYSAWIGLFTILPLIAFIVHLFLTTYYTIETGKLSIKCGFLYDSTIDIKTIRKISETSNPISSPATSLDRLEIISDKDVSIIISPKDKQGFINELVKLNPIIKIKYKEK